MSIFTLNSIELLFVTSCTTFIITFSKLFLPLRERIAILKCSLCSSFWVGILYAMTDSIYYNKNFDIFYIFKMGIASSVLSFATYHLLHKLEK